MPVVIFRYDDYHADRGAKDTSKSQIEYRLLEIFSRWNVPLTMGVVPNVAEDYEVPSSPRYYPLAEDGEKLQALKTAVERGIIEPALHGWQHEAVFKNGRQSEFMGLTFDAQLSKIQQGQRTLEDCLETSVSSFIPPWNTYDEQTIRALDAVNIRALSAAFGTARHGEAAALVFLPRTCALSEFDQARMEIEKVENGLRAVPAEGVTFIVMMFHHFSFFESDDKLARQYANVSLEQLESIVERCARDASVQTLSIGEAARRYQEQLSDGRFAAAVQYDDGLRRLRDKRFIGGLAHRYPHRAFYPVEFYRKRLRWLGTLTGLKFSQGS
jgi:hypothetical protein